LTAHIQQASVENAVAVLPQLFEQPCTTEMKISVVSCHVVGGVMTKSILYLWGCLLLLAACVNHQAIVSEAASKCPQIG
ncbi:hypothetical protein ACO1NJ_14890, partial [Staphylococcus aureus]